MRCFCYAFAAILLLGSQHSAQASATATPVDAIKVPDGFKVELLYSVPSDEQGSWVSLATDPKGRLIASDQYGKLYRITPAEIGGNAGTTKVEPLSVDIGMAQGLLYAFDSLYVVVNGKPAGKRGQQPGGDNQQSGLYRVRDTNGDDQFDEVKLLRNIEGAGEHGPHAVILSPDGKSLYIAGGNHTKIPDPETSRVPRNWQEDQLLPRMWDAGGHAVGVMAPGGWVCKTDPDGKNFELVCSGFRNEYDIAFNPEGELFTFDADMEWDIGAPWYRPTRVCHVVSGGEFGWRSGSGKWPEYYPDSLPAAVDIGPGSPTGIAFGTGAKFPAKFQQALFIADWSYGVIYAVHLQPRGASYTGQFERFVSAAPLPVTDMLVNPKDGSLYFAIGGRRTQSGLYRVTYTGEESTASVAAPKATANELRDLRRKLEKLHVDAPESAIDIAWPHLAHPDRFISYAARIAVEHQPVSAWQDRALAEKDPRAVILAMVALARCGDKALLPKIVQKLDSIDWARQDEAQQLSLLRAYGLAFARMGQPSDSDRSKVLSKLDSLYPAESVRLNRELSQLLIYLEAPRVVERTLALTAKAPTQEEQIHYAFSLRSLKSGWTLDQRREYFTWFNKGAQHRGGHSLSGFIANTRTEAIATLGDDEKKQLASVLEAVPKPEPLPDTPPRSFVKQWTVAELASKAEAAQHGRNFRQGRELFAAANCFKCHRFAGEGGNSGPDLTGAGNRFNTLNLLESIIEPSKVISDQYDSTAFMLDDGRTIVGRVANLNGEKLMVIENLLEPGKLTEINRGRIEEMKRSPVSMMPTGLLDTLNEEEILDLLAYLRSGGNPQHELFSKN